MAEITGLNGAPLRDEKKRVISLEYDMRNGALRIDSAQLEGNMDLCINILEQAVRFMRNQQLVGQIIQTGQAMERDSRLIAQALKPQ